MVHFILTALVESHSSTKRGSFGLCTVIFLSLYTAYLYYSTALPLNAPNKTVDEMALLFAAIFFLYEIRLSIGREKWKGYISFGFIAALICGYSAIPSLIVYLAKGEIISNNIYETALVLTLFIFIMSRLILTGELTEDKECKTVTSLIKFAESRHELINPICKESYVVEISGEELTKAEENADSLNENDENQITIDDVETEIVIEDEKENHINDDGLTEDENKLTESDK